MNRTEHSASRTLAGDDGIILLILAREIWLFEFYVVNSSGNETFSLELLHTMKIYNSEVILIINNLEQKFASFHSPEGG